MLRSMGEAANLQIHVGHMQARFHFLQQAGHVKGQVRPVAIDGKLLGMQHHLLTHPLGVLPSEIVERHGGVVLRRLGLDGADAQFSRSVSERLRDQEVYLARTRPRAIFLAGLFPGVVVERMPARTQLLGHNG